MLILRNGVLLFIANYIAIEVVVRNLWVPCHGAAIAAIAHGHRITQTLVQNRQQSDRLFKSIAVFLPQNQRAGLAAGDFDFGHMPQAFQIQCPGQLIFIVNRISQQCHTCDQNTPQEGAHNSALYYVARPIPDADFFSMNRRYTAEETDLSSLILELLQQLYSKEKFGMQIESMMFVMRRMEQTTACVTIPKDYAYEYIGKLFTTPENGHALRMDTKIFTGEATIRYFGKLAGRTGHAFKKNDRCKFAAVTFKN